MRLKVEELEVNVICPDDEETQVKTNINLDDIQIEKIMTKFDVDSVWTSGRLCNFHGCDAPHLQPKHINGDNHHILI